MELADLVLGPSNFVGQTIREFVDKPFAVAPYGVDTEFWRPSDNPRVDGPLRFIYAGQISIRKGIPLLLEAWERAQLNDAELLLVGSWQLAKQKLNQLPANVIVHPPCSANELRFHYQSADVFVFPSYFEGFGLVLLEAMACGLPILATERTAAPDFVSDDTGMIVKAGDSEGWIAALRSVSGNRERWLSMRQFARKLAEKSDWQRYRAAVNRAIDTLIN